MRVPRALSRLLLSFTVVILLSLPAAAQAPGTGLRGTRHDFSGFGSPGSGLCTFCHTPHRAATTTLLWNHRLSPNVFQWDVPSTTAGTPFPTFRGDTYQGPTTKCLSCHDGSVAIGDVNWWNGDRGSFPQGRLSPRDPATIGLGGSLAGNHPVAMPYPFRQARSTYNGVRTGPAIALRDWQPDPTTLGIRLFHDDGSGIITAGPALTREGRPWSRPGCAWTATPRDGRDPDAHSRAGNVDISSGMATSEGSRPRWPGGRSQKCPREFRLNS